MKQHFRMPLRWRITLMTGAVVFISSLCMMMVNIYFANDGFDVVMTNVNYYYQNSIENSQVTSALNEMEGELIKNSENQFTGKNVIVVGDPQFVHFDAIQDDLSMLMEDQLTDADASSSSVYFPDNRAISRKFNSIAILTLFLCTLMGMVIAYVLSARALRPIQELNQSVLTITGNNLNRRVEESGINDEVGSLQKSFNSMMDRLEASFKRQKEFSRNVAHELKTPLTTMKTGIQVMHMDEHPSSEEMLEVLSVTEKNIDRLISIVQDLLLFTKEERIEFNDAVCVQNLLLQILEDHRLSAEKQKISLHLQCKQNCTVMQNEALLTRAFNNLIENAIKYNVPDGSVHITVKPLKSSVRIEIADTGIGIEKSHLDQIWEPFYCEDESRSRKSGGAGIGLALVKSISEKCGFEVSVSSEKGKGSVFAVELPYHL